MERVTFGSLMSNIVVIGLDGEIRTLEQGQLPKPGELIINEVSDTSELVIEQVIPQGSSINVTGDITALIEAIAAGQDPTQLGQEFETAAGEANGSSPQTTGNVARTGTELLASTNFETVGTEGAGFSTTQILTLLDILPPTQAPAPTGIPIPVTITVQDISSPAVDEGQQVSFDVTLNQPTEEETTIEFTLNDGSAVGGAASDVGADYVNTTVLITLSDGTTQEIQVNDDGSFTVSLPIGEESFTVSLDTIDDNLAEGSETFSLSGSTPDQPTPVTGVATITDEAEQGPEDTVTVNMTGPNSVSEGETTSEYTVTLSEPAPVGSIVTLAYSYTTASGDDITETTQAVVGADGVSATFTIDTVDDVYAEGDEVFRVSVSGIVDSDSNPIFEALNLDNAFVDTTISDETDPGPEDTVTVTMTGPANVVEGDTTTEYTVTLSDPAPVGSIVTLAYSYTTASGDDITETTQAIIGADGVTATFTIDTVDDVYAEGDEVFRVSVSGIVDSDSNPIFEALDVSNAFVDTTISDETDPGPEDTVTVTMTGPASVVEGDTTTEYTVTLSDPAPVGSIVTLAYSYTTASGDDITETTQAIIGVDGVTATFTIDTVDDVYAEGDEVFRVSVSGIVDSDSNPIFEALDVSNAFVDTTISDETDPGPEDTVTVTMTGPANVVEGDTTTEYTVTLSDPAPVGSIVTLAYSYTTASGDDITETTQAVVGADGVTATFTIDTVDDVYAEGDEVFRVSVSGIVDSDSNPIFEALNLDNAFVDTTISDETGPGPEDTVTVTMTGPANVVEGDTTTEYTVTLSDPAPVGSIVTLAYSYTTASGDDITETTQAIIGADGVTATFTIDTVDDVYAEGDEVFRVSVSGIVDSDSNPIFEALNLDNAFVDTTISDETDPGPEDTVTVTMTGPANVVEGDTTTDYTVTLSDPAPVGSIVTLAYSYTTASGDDITETTQAVIGADGLSATFTIDTVDDVYAEGDEVFRVSVSGIVDSDSNPIFEALNLDNAFVDTTISDETDPGPEDTVTVTMTGPANVVEGDTTTEYTVTLSDPAPVGSIVTLVYSYATASGDDITETTQAIIGADGVTATFTIDTVDDVYAEGDEVFRVSVSGIVDSDSNPIFEALNLDNAFVDTTISDETDPGPEDTVTVTMTGPANVVEGDTTTEYTVTLSDPAPVGSIVTLAYSYTTASGDDITETTQAIIGADGVTATFTIDTVDDVYAEGDEVFRVSVSGIVDSDSNPIFEALNLDNAFVDTTISDETDPGPEDTVTVTMTGPANVVEGDTTTDYTVTLSDPAPVGSIVTLAYSYTTASGDDITETAQAIIGADGVTATFTIDTVDDVYAEGDEVFRVSVSGIVDSDSNPIFEALDVSNAFVDTTISDETDPGPEDTVTVTMTGPANVVEGDTTTDYTVTLSDPAPVGSIVTLAYSYTTASGDDITETTQAVIGADGVTATFTIDTVDDVYAEGDEVFRVSVSGIVDGDSNPIFEALDVSNAFVDTTISDETNPGPEDTVTVTMTGPANVVEGDTTTEYTVTLSVPAPVGSIVTLAYSYTTASGDDITETTQAIIGADGVTATFTIDTVDDVYAEGDEVFRVSVSGIVDGDSNPIFEALDVSNAFVDTTISDETDPGPEDTVTMTGPANVVEGDTTTDYTVTLSDPAPVGSIVTLAYSYTTASGDDITETTQAIIGADGVTATFTIDTVDDVYAEGDEVFRVSVSGIVDSDSNPIFEALNLDNAFVDTTISDETDPGPEDTVTVTMTGPANVVEGDTTTDYTVTLSDPAPVGSIVTLAYSYTTASGDDITETTQAIIGADGVTATFTIDTVDDSDDEPDEVYRVSVASIVDGDDNPIFEALDLTNAYVDTTIIDNDEPNTPPIARDFIISLNVQEGIFPVQDVEFDGLTSTNEQRVEDIEDDAVAANDGDILIQVVDLPEHGELYYVDGNGQEVIIDETTQFPENTEVKYRLTDDFFDEQSFDSADLLEDQGKDILVNSYTPPNSNLTFTGGQIITVGNSIIFDSDAQISVDFANQQVGLVVVSPNETGQGDEISTGEYITLELDEDLSANEAKLNLASLNDRFNNGGAWLTAYIFLNGALVDVQQFYSTDINYTSNHEGSITVSLANGSFDEIRLTPETDSSSNKASFTLVGTEITSFTDVNDDFTYQAIDTDGAISNEATVAVDFENVTVDAVTALGYQTMALNSELNLIMGTDGDDILVGTDGNDMIIGGLGNDILTGGEGDDVFKWTEMQSATDTVTDFSDGDQLDFTDVFDDMTGTDISALLDDLGSGDYRGRVDDITVEVTESGGNSTLTINKDGQQLEVNFDGASAADIANSLISNLEQLRE
ncbi:Calx-beta domain-containing protein [Vibrio parahaemolyticus]|nr:Calx-beta domain-containing protein [Vibrio parahaemolyticus]MDF4428386.1 Calx-beta domain-containing protein [Vibrio parahaemolyticus]MDF4437376.1 Calx-beta domain-containing protein [Vibrio parahaemolyticus]MDF4446868.1 Calx-beta domain-containing protein [Vibrio parahaemolyticus]